MSFFVLVCFGFHTELVFFLKRFETFEKKKKVENHCFCMKLI